MKKVLVIFLITFPIVMFAQQTYVPDYYFEQALIDLGLDTPPHNDSIPTKNIDTLKSLYIEGRSISDLTGSEDFISLESLNCSFNNLTILEVRKNPALKRLDCSHNLLTSLDVSKNTTLTVLDCASNKLTSLEVGKNSSLKRLSCSYNKLTSLNVSNNFTLEELLCRSNRLTNLDIKNGNNANMNAEWDDCFDARNNPNLACIQVDDSAFSVNNEFWYKDSIAIYSEDCGAVSVNDYKIGLNNVSIFPNPTTDFIEISVGANGRSPLQSDIKIFNVLGEIQATPNPTPLHEWRGRVKK